MTGYLYFSQDLAEQCAVAPSVDRVSAWLRELEFPPVTVLGVEHDRVNTYRARIEAEELPYEHLSATMERPGTADPDDEPAGAKFRSWCRGVEERRGWHTCAGATPCR